MDEENTSSEEHNAPEKQDDPPTPTKRSINSYYGNKIGFLQTLSLTLNAGLMVRHTFFAAPPLAVVQTYFSHLIYISTCRCTLTSEYRLLFWAAKILLLQPTWIPLMTLMINRQQPHQIIIQPETQNVMHKTWNYGLKTGERPHVQNILITVLELTTLVVSLIVIVLKHALRRILVILPSAPVALEVFPVAV